MLGIINGFLSCLIQTMTLFCFGLIIFNRKKEKFSLKIILVLLFSIIAHTIVFLTIAGIIKTVLLCVIFSLTIKFIFNIEINKSIIASIVYIIFLIISELFAIGIFTKIFNMSKVYFDKHIAGGILGNIIVGIILILISFILKKILRKGFSYNLSTSKKIILVSLIALITIVIFFYNLISSFKLNEGIAAYLFVIIALIIILFYLFKQKIDNDAILKKYDDLLTIMKTYESDIEEQRINIHETRNELMTIKSKIKDKEKEKNIIKYIDSIIGDKVSSSISKYSKFAYLPSNGLKGFFYYKFLEADNKGIDVSINISEQVQDSILNKLDTKDFKNLTRMIGVYLDNAIDASLESKEKKVGIEIYLIGENVEIIISNTYSNKIDKDKLGNEVYTSKGKNHGHGLLLAKHILNDSKLFKSESKMTKNIYTQKLTIKNK